MTRLLGLGLDVCGFNRWRRVLARHPDAERLAFTAAERAWGRRDPKRLAYLWSAKEATVKALGCGFEGVDWREVSLDLQRVPPLLTIPDPRENVPAWSSARNVAWLVHLGRLGEAAIALILAVDFDSARSSDMKEAPHLMMAFTFEPVWGIENTRSARAAAERLACRKAVKRATAVVTGSSTENVETSRDTAGRPMICLPENIVGSAPDGSLLVSMSHCSGWAGAAVGMPTQ